MPSRTLLRRGGTIAATATALVMGGGGIALGATTHEVTGTGLGTPAPVHVVQSIAPRPRPQDPPVPGAVSLPKPVTSLGRTVVAPTVTTVTTTVRGLRTPRQTPPPASTPGSTAPHAPKAPHSTSRHQASTHAAVVRHAIARVPRSESEQSLPTAHDAAFVQRTDPTVTPQLSPSISGPLADLPGYARDAIPTALVVVAAAIIAGLAAGHLGLWHRRRTGLV